MAQDTVAKNSENKQAPVPREIGTLGLKYVDGRILEDARKELQFPRSIQTFDEMSQNVAIASALNAVNIIASRVPIYFEPYDQSTRHVERAKFVEDCLFKDMTHSFYDFLREALTINKYGFSIHEKVFRRRLRKKGSKYDDGKIGIQKLPIRAQASVDSWKFNEEVTELQGFYQKPSNDKRYGINIKDKVYIPREDFLLFRTDPINGNPEGRSPLVACYEAWRKVQLLLEAEEIAAFKNLNGIPVLKIPAIYMSEDATPEHKQVYKTFKDGVTKLGIGEQQAIVIPSDRDENSSPYFDFDVKSSTASNITALSGIIQTRTNEIYQCLFADVLQMGNERGGNSNLAQNKASMLNMLVEVRLKEIFDQINRDLIPHLFRWNKWDDTKTPQIKFGKLADLNFAEYAKAMQQLKATKLIAVTPENVNFIAEVMQLPFRVPLDATKEELDEILGVDQEDDSRSADGYSSDTGGLNGTSSSVSEEDNSANNLSNK